ncbi:MAG: hypothetical protein ACI8QD_002220 [Cyclobacteriaceae bacterium]|jgi:hypothetical protein
MDKHTNSYHLQKERLKKEEQEIRDELDVHSNELEKKAFTFLKISAGIGASVLLAYGIFRLIKGKELDKKELQSSKKPSKNKGSFDRIISSSTDLITKLAIDGISNYLDKFIEKAKEVKR